MKVKELIEKLQREDPEASVILIPKNTRFINPAISVDAVGAGFDWYAGMVILGTNRDITCDFSDVESKKIHKKETV